MWSSSKLLPINQKFLCQTALVLEESVEVERRSGDGIMQAAAVSAYNVVFSRSADGVHCANDRRRMFRLPLSNVVDRRVEPVQFDDVERELFMEFS